MPYNLAKTRKLWLNLYKYVLIDIFKYAKVIHENIQCLFMNSCLFFFIVGQYISEKCMDQFMALLLQCEWNDSSSFRPSPT